MTSNDRTATPPENPDDVDLFVSRRVDGEISPLDVPEDLRVDVERRVGVVSALRSQLRATVDGIQLSESRISSALAAAGTPRTRGRRIHGGRPTFAVAASLVFLLAATVLAVRQFDSGRGETLTEGVDAIAEDARGGNSPVGGAAAQEQSSLSSVSSPSGQIESKLSSDAASATIPEFATQEDVESFIASTAVVESKSAASDIEPWTAVCGNESARPLLVRVVSLQGRTIEIQVYESGRYAAYDVEDCSLVFERTSIDVTAPPG